MATMPITLPQLEAAARQWVTENRAGENLTDDEVGALAIEHVAAESAAHLLWYLRETAPRAGDPVLRVSLAHVHGVMLGWEKSRRAGLCLPADRVAERPADQVAADMAAYLWECFSIAAGAAEAALLSAAELGADLCSGVSVPPEARSLTCRRP